MENVNTFIDGMCQLNKEKTFIFLQDKHQFTLKCVQQEKVILKKKTI